MILSVKLSPKCLPHGQCACPRPHLTTRGTGKCNALAGHCVTPIKSRTVTREVGSEHRQTSSRFHFLSSPRQDRVSYSPLYKDEKDETWLGGPAQSCSRLVVKWAPSSRSAPAWKHDGDTKTGTHEHLWASISCEPKAICPGGVKLADEGAAEGNEDKGCRHQALCHCLGWQEVASFGLGSIGRADRQELSTASKSARRQRHLPPHCVSKPTVPTRPQPAAGAQD